jgi:putative ABC transport system permease protein
VRTRKVLRDLWSDKARTLLVVLSIAVGVFALSLTLRTRAMLSHNMLTSYAAIAPADASLTISPFDGQLVKAIRRLPGVRSAAGESHLDVRVRVGEHWQQMILIAVPDFQNMQINRLAPAGGAWPPPKRTLLLERSYLDVVGLRIGDDLLIETPGGRQVQMPVTGVAHDLTAASGRLGSLILFGYISLDTSEALGLSQEMNTLQITVAGDPFDAARVRQVVDDVRARSEKNGHRFLRMFIPEPRKPQLYGIVISILDTLRALGVLSLVLSALLVINTIAGLLARQVPQIGMLKAIGARRRDIVLIYLGGVLVLAVLGLLVAVPLAVVGSRALTLQLAHLLNYDVQSFVVPAYVITLEIVAGLLVPVLAGLYSIVAGTHLTVRQAITGQPSGQFGRSALDRLLGRYRGGPVTQLYALRNMVRRKGRLALTLAALALGGAVAIAVLSVRASLFTTLDQAADYWQQDITLMFDQPYRVDQIRHQVAQVPGVVGMENQPAELAVRQRPDGSDAERPSAIFGLRPGSSLLQPTILRGRWLTADDTDAIVVNVSFLKHEPDVRIGDAITLKIGERKTHWKVVGVVTTQLFTFKDSAPDQGMMYANAPALTEAIQQTGRTSRVLVVTERHDPAFQDRVAQALVAQLANQGIQGVTQTGSAVRAQVAGYISAIVFLMLAMVCMFILVAGLSLMGAMSLNVLDRTKEIGVLRAIGAPNGSVMRIVVTEGMYTGILSWLIATLLALPLSRIISDLIGWSITSWPLVYSFPPIAILIWLVIAIVLAAAASYLPAARAARLSVRDVLAYE